MALLALAAIAAGASASSPGGYLLYDDLGGRPYTVGYTNRSLTINGRPGFFASVGVHYPRFTPGQWDDVLLKAKRDGYNMVQTYFFHNVHQPKLHVYPWIQEGPANLRLFLEKARAAGLFVDLRIGPYVCAEWSWGGYPYDIAEIPGLVSRSSSPAWESYMTATVLNVTREFRDLFADKGGPIMLGQIENELHSSDTDYIKFCGDLAVKTGVPIAWGMCNGNSADNTINTCNGGDCTNFIEQHGQNHRVLIDQPALWTENWMGWFASWGGSSPAGDWPSFDSTQQSAAKSYGILRWVARGGSHVNFYNWAGGNHFARFSGSSMVNNYYWQAPLASDNLAQGPERQHMARTYEAIARVAKTLLNYPAQVHREIPLVARIVAFAYKGAGSGEKDVVFLENSGGATYTVAWAGVNYTVPGQSTSLVHGVDVIFNSANVTPTEVTHVWTPTPVKLRWSQWKDTAIPTSAADARPPTQHFKKWEGSALGRVVRASAPLEAVQFTEYDSELCVYSANISDTELNSALAAASEGKVNITLASAKAQAWTVFIDGVVVGTGWELSHGGGTAVIAVQLNATAMRSLVSAARGHTSVHALALLSTSLGIDNGGGVHNTNASMSSTGIKGITSTAPGSVMFGGVDLTTRSWTHQVGAAGEAFGAASDSPGIQINWTVTDGPSAPPMSWLKATFEAPAAAVDPDPNGERNATLNLDATGLSRGRFFVNGMDLGRYWTKSCGGNICQRFYPIPFDILERSPGINRLTVLDELGATNISAVQLAVSANLPPPPPPPCPVPMPGTNVTLIPCNSPTAALKITAADTKSHGSSVALMSNPKLCMKAAAGAAAVTWALCSEDAGDQTWMLPGGTSPDAVHLVTDGVSAKCLDVFDQVKSAGALLDMWKCHAGANQLWSLRAGPAENAPFQLVSSLDQLCVGAC